MTERVRPTRAYNRAHYAARKHVGPRCERCGSTERREAALRPDAPAERLYLDPNIKCLYSEHVEDYFTLCVPCHRQLDHVELRPACSKGHAYTAENTSIKSDGSRRCLTCHRGNEARRLTDPAARAAKNEWNRKRPPLTPEQKERKHALQRLRRQRGRA
jgi:hypothetical protein